MREFQYYYGNDAENFNFFRLPKKLVRDKQFRSLSSDAKILYGMLLDRMTLSSRNGWLDEEGRIYIIFTIEEIAEELYCSKRKAVQLMNELDCRSGIGLIERRRRGMGRPNLIYVKNFNTAGSDSEKVAEKEKRGEISSPRKEVQKCALQEVQKRAPQEVQKRAPQEVQERAPQEVQEHAPQNDTDKNDTDTIYNNLSIHLADYAEDGWKDRELLQKILKKRLGYECLTHDSPEDAEQVKEIIELLTDVCHYARDSLMINGSYVSAEAFRRRMMELNMEHVRYVISCLKQNTGKIKNVRGYLLTCLYNAPLTIKTYYQAEVQHDMSNRNREETTCLVKPC